MTHPEPIRFLFDFISPYAYLAWTQIHALADRHGRQVLPVPILFAALLNTYGHKGPAEIPPKRAYVFKDTLRRAALFGVPLSPPPTHPFNPLLALRASSLPMPEDKRRDLISALFRATWAGGAGVESPESVAAAATSVGLDGESIVAEASTPEAKARVRAQTESAVAQGAFGVPSIVIGQELFWGLDSFDLVERYLRG
ncbi:MAG: 2-hydroxychromene-2-carboxylate isomerase, partial [Polyangiaceae bacterium]